MEMVKRGDLPALNVIISFRWKEVKAWEHGGKGLQITLNLK